MNENWLNLMCQKGSWEISSLKLVCLVLNASFYYFVLVYKCTYTKMNEFMLKITVSCLFILEACSRSVLMKFLQNLCYSSETCELSLFFLNSTLNAVFLYLHKIDCYKACI